VVVHDGPTAAAIKEEVGKAAFVVAKVNRRRRQQKAPPPFVTAKLQQAAYARYHFPVRKTMQLAQRLYEGVDLGGGERVGLITYMRTDSVRVAAEALDAVRHLIAGQFGNEYLPERPNFFKNRSEAQDAHEAVRPSEVDRTPESLASYLAPDELKLYTLIWQRFVGSQMVPAQFDVTDVVVEAGRYGFKVRGEVEVDPGFLRVYREEAEPDKPAQASPQEQEEEEVTSRRLPPLEVGQTLTLEEFVNTQKFTQPPPRFTESTLVKALEENGIGRPSTYAQIITTIADRSYVTRVKGTFPPDHARQAGQQLADRLVRRPDQRDVHRADGGAARRDRRGQARLAAGDRHVLGRVHDRPREGAQRDGLGQARGRDDRAGVSDLRRADGAALWPVRRVPGVLALPGVQDHARAGPPRRRRGSAGLPGVQRDDAAQALALRPVLGVLPLPGVQGHAQARLPEDQPEHAERGEVPDVRRGRDGREALQARPAVLGVQPLPGLHEHAAGQAGAARVSHVRRAVRAREEERAPRHRTRLRA
jgi:hypothetical protein